jgi:hypothetical protein
MRSICEPDEAALSSCHFENDKVRKRTGIERRQFSYSLYIPERRKGEERRHAQERREPDRSQ